MIPREANVLRIYITADDRCQGKPLYEAIVEKARASGLAGASVFGVDISYGANRQLHDVNSEYLFAGLPVVVELVDGPDAIRRFLAEVGTIVKEGLCVVTRARVARYVHPAELDHAED